MKKDIFNTTDFNDSPNEIKITLAEKQWFSRHDMPTQDQVARDMIGQTLTINGINFETYEQQQKEKDSSYSPYQDQTNWTEEQRNTFRTNFNTWLNQQLGEKLGTDVNQHYNQTIIAFGHNIMLVSLKSGTHILSSERSANIEVKNGEVYQTCIYTNLKVNTTSQSGEKEETFTIPGTLETTFKLDTSSQNENERGFKLISVIPSNSLLKELCLGNNDVEITEEKIKKAQESLNNSAKNEEISLTSWLRKKWHSFKRRFLSPCLGNEFQEINKPGTTVKKQSPCPIKSNKTLIHNATQENNCQSVIKPTDDASTNKKYSFRSFFNVPQRSKEPVQDEEIGCGTALHYLLLRMTGRSL